MIREKYYRNAVTGEVSESHAEAMAWYRSGIAVEIYRRGQPVVSLVSPGVRQMTAAPEVRFVMTYMNLDTKEFSASHKVAMAWHQAGHAVSSCLTARLSLGEVR